MSRDVIGTVSAVDTGAPPVALPTGAGTPDNLPFV